MIVTAGLHPAGLQDNPVPTPTIDPELVSPGPLGFFAMALIVAAVFVLCLDLVRRIRRLNYRAEANAALDLEEQQLRAAEEARAQDSDEQRAADAAVDARDETADSRERGD